MSRPAAYLTSHRLYSEPPKFYEAMLHDIERAERYIYLETYKFGNDEVGLRFREALTKASARGVHVKVLLDSWGVSYNESFFSELISQGGEVRFFRKILYTFDFFTKNHRRNHRKFLLIDDQVSYLGSANITAYSLQWRESVIRLTGGITLMFKRSFLESYKIYKKYIFNKFTFKKSKFIDEFELVEDMPSIYRQRIKTKLERLISKAKREIIIETPYFLPGHKMRKILADAAGRGVSVKIILPRHSDVRSIDLLSSKYYGFYYSNNINLILYTLNNLHAKLLLIDDETFGIGSPNIDYRSFRYQHEVMLFGSHKGILAEVRNHVNDTMLNCMEFDHLSWMRRPKIEKVLGWLLLPFRHMF
ncbi:MAG: phosphatidylserine/phosphatidylglycerophosphate/cardiolipin synthase family protein [Bacteroidota bacterium]